MFLDAQQVVLDADVVIEQFVVDEYPQTVELVPSDRQRVPNVELELERQLALVDLFRVVHVDHERRLEHVVVYVELVRDDRFGSVCQYVNVSMLLLLLFLHVIVVVGAEKFISATHTSVLSAFRTNAKIFPNKIE